jgi:hypothetical protein
MNILSNTAVDDLLNDNKPSFSKVFQQMRKRKILLQKQ